MITFGTTTGGIGEGVGVGNGVGVGVGVGIGDGVGVGVSVDVGIGVGVSVGGVVEADVSVTVDDCVDADSLTEAVTELSGGFFPFPFEISLRSILSIIKILCAGPDKDSKQSNWEQKIKEFCGYLPECEAIRP